MSERTSSKPGIADYVVARRKRKECFLDEIDRLIDVAVEEALYDRFSFVRFVGLSLEHDEVPDASTICRFRQSLVERDVQKTHAGQAQPPVAATWPPGQRGSHRRCHRRFVRAPAVQGARRAPAGSSGRQRGRDGCDDQLFR